MKLPPLKIRHLESKFPVIQAGMGVRVGNADLAAATVRLGGYGTIASVGLGDIEKSKMDFVNESNRVLALEIRKARESCAGGKPLGVNIMVALSNYRELVEESVRSGADFIISGAGLPLALPEYAGNADVALIPVVSSGRALSVIVNAWKRKYCRAPDAVIVEGPRNGGHLGFTCEMIEQPETCSLAMILKDVKKVMTNMGYGRIPVLAAEMIASRRDIERMLSIGYDGVQVGTHLIASEEAGLDLKSKDVYVKATREDVTVIQSPVGLPVRVLKTPLVNRVLSGNKEKFRCPYRCLRTCNPGQSSFCIAKALLATWKGDVENGLYMTGCNVEAIKGVYPLKSFFRTLDDFSFKPHPQAFGLHWVKRSRNRSFALSMENITVS